MKKIFTFFVALGLSMSLAATTFTFGSAEAVNQTIDGITVALNKAAGNNPPAYIANSSEMRLYAKNTITVTGEGLEDIQLVFAHNEGKTYASLTASTGNLVSGGTSTGNKDWKVDHWTGNAGSVVFTLGSESKGQRIIREIVVNGDSIVIEPDTPVEPEDEPQELDSTFLYGEPTVIFSPDTNMYKQAYTFVDNNIRVSCTQGSIISNDTDAYFNCNAGFALKFEATQPFKGVVLKGYVRKAFSASVDRGDIEFLSPEYADEEADPVVVIKNIDSTAFTISCDKQLRVSAARFYFEENPTEVINDTTETEGETIFLTFNAADAVYETEISEDEGKTNYTVFLYNEEAEYPYIALDLYPTAVGELVGQYDTSDGSMGELSWYQFSEAYLDYTVATEGQLVINREEDTYTISGYLTCDDNNTYNFTFSGAMPFYTDDEYYEDEEGVENVQGQVQATKVLRNGQLYILRGDKMYNVLGF